MAERRSDCKPLRRAWRAAILATVAALLLTGCAASPAVKFYTLVGLPPEAAPSAGRTGAPLTLGLGPVTLPDYLDRPQIVSRASEYRLEVAEFHRWAEPLAGNVARVLAENLTARLPGLRVAHYPWPARETPGCQVRIELGRFEAGTDAAVHLAATWTVAGREGGVAGGPRWTSLSVPAPRDDFEATIRAQSEALARLSDEIAEDISFHFP